MDNVNLTTENLIVLVVNAGCGLPYYDYVSSTYVVDILGQRSFHGDYRDALVYMYRELVTK